MHMYQCLIAYIYICITHGNFLSFLSTYSRKKSRKWDVPAENVEKNDAVSSSASDAAQRARERAAELAAKLAAKGKLVSNAPPPPIIVSKSNFDQVYLLLKIF